MSRVLVEMTDTDRRIGTMDRRIKKIIILLL